MAQKGYPKNKKGVLIPLDWSENLEGSFYMYGVLFYYILKYANDRDFTPDELEKSLMVEARRFINYYEARKSVSNTCSLYRDLTQNHLEIKDFSKPFEEGDSDD
jgi:hypothetical protein